MNKWDEYFMNIAKETAKLSKDPRTKVGAVIVKGKKLLSVGYNGAPIAMDDSLIPTSEGEGLLNQKNTYMVHAELNAILNYKGQIQDLEGSTVYVTVSPCTNCVLVLSQVGIKNVIYLDAYHREEIHNAATYIMDKCGINYCKFGENNED